MAIPGVHTVLLSLMVVEWPETLVPAAMDCVGYGYNALLLVPSMATPVVAIVIVVAAMVTLLAFVLDLLHYDLLVIVSLWW